MLLLSLMWACSGGKNSIETDCADSVDNDSDGFTDCEDADCSATCLSNLDTDDTSDTDDTDDDKPEDTGDKPEDTSDPDSGEEVVVDCSEESNSNQITGSYNGVDYNFSSAIWDYSPDEVAMLMSSNPSEDLNGLCSLVFEGGFEKQAHLSLRTFNITEFPITVQLEEPQGGDQNYVALVDEDIS